MLLRKWFICFFTLVCVTAYSIPINAQTQMELDATLRSESVVLIDATSGQVLYEKNMHKKMYPASITKIMTALLALEKGDLNSQFTMSYDSVFSIGRDTSHIALDVGETLTLEQALYALALQSANDAANGIAEHIAGSMDGFANMMTDRAKQAGALNTNFVNAHGLYDSEHYTTAYDMAKITMEAVKLPEFSNIFGALSYEMPPTNKQPETRYFNCSNAMMTGKYKYEGLVAEKTGWTDLSQHTLVTVAKRDNRTLIAVVLKSVNSKDKWEDTISLLDYGFNEFKQITLKKDYISKNNYTYTDSNGNSHTVNLTSKDDYTLLIKNNMAESDVKIEYNLDSKSGDINALFRVDLSYQNEIFENLGEATLHSSIKKISDGIEQVSNNTVNEKIKPVMNKGIQWFFIVPQIILIVIILYFFWTKKTRKDLKRHRRRMRMRKSNRYKSNYSHRR